MKLIKMEQWPRNTHFNLYKAFDNPHFSMCANVDITSFFSFIKRCNFSVTISIAYVISRAANALQEFRYRIRGETVVEHDIISPSFTILIDNDLFSFCRVDYTEKYSEFALRAAESIARVKINPVLDNDPERDDLLYMTSIPWVAFTSFNHPIHLHPPDSIPRFVWGKMFDDRDLMKMPLGVQAHHAVMDGLHIGRFYEKIQEYFYHPKEVLVEN